MYLTNTTFVVEPSVQTQWLDIIKKHYLPLLEKSGYELASFSRVISAEAVDHFTYSILVNLPDMASYKALTENLFPEYLTIADPLFGSQVLWFTTLMKKIDTAP